MKREKKVNSYLRGIKMIALACVIGGVIGGVTGAIRFALLSRGVAVSGDWVLQQIRSQLVPILGIIFAVTVILEELCFHKLKGICEKQVTAEDEECDQLEYEEEKNRSIWYKSECTVAGCKHFLPDIRLFHEIH